MKLHYFIFVVSSLVLQIRASFIDDFHHAVRHVEYGFEKILSDVVTDMEDTIHCTVAAMEHILIINGILDKLSDYNKKCPDDYSRQTHHEIILDSSSQGAEKKYVTSQDLHSSLQNVNLTLNSIIARRTTEDIVEGSISDSFRDENRRLSEVSSMLQRELEKIFSNVRVELDKIDFNKSPDAVVRDEIRLLQKVEKDGNTPELDEIRHVVDDALSVLKSNENSNFKKRNNNEINKIVTELEHTRSESVQNYKDNKNHKSSTGENVFTITERKHLIQHTNHNENKPSNYVSPLFTSFGKSNEKETISEVIDMVKEDQVVNLLFKDEQPGADVFANAHLFHF